MALNNSQILYRIGLISHGFTGRSHFRSICPSKARYFDRRRIPQNGFVTSKLLPCYVSMKYHVSGLLIRKQRCPYDTHWAIRRNICISRNRNPTTFNKLLYNLKCHSIRFQSSKRRGRKFDGKPRNLFDVLEATPKSHASEIKKSFYRLSKQYHPDMNKSDEAAVKFAEISAAYEVLKDPKKRRFYERGITVVSEMTPEDMRKYKSEVVTPEEHFNKQINDKSQIRRRGLSNESDFWLYYGSMKDSRKTNHEDIDVVLKRFREEEKQRKAKGLLGGTVALAFLLAIMFWK